MDVFTGKTAFVTGGAQGIGLSMAKAFLNQGMRVAIADIKTEKLKEAESILDSPDEVLAIEVDVRDREAVEAAADKTETAFGKVHVVCNNAGIAAGGPAVSCSSENWYRTLDTNLHGALNGIQVFAPRIARHGEGGHIVNTASITGFAQQGGGVPYGLSKAAIIAMTELLRVELAGKHAKDRWQNMYGAGRDRWGEEGPPETFISASVLCPDAVDTEMSAFYTNPRDDEETRQRKIQWLKSMDIELIKPDLVGEQVVDAIRNDELYIFCDGYGSRRLLKRRTQAMLDAFDRQFPE
ncbi:MAG: SDR family oxidoreductase [Candidatus Hydrogenedentes bacterium]|nr:SDR family oxidoreductase [Candidatus Hydrogenedentota bacterium]